MNKVEQYRLKVTLGTGGSGTACALWCPYPTYPNIVGKELDLLIEDQSRIKTTFGFSSFVTANVPTAAELMTVVDAAHATVSTAGVASQVRIITSVAAKDITLYPGSVNEALGLPNLKVQIDASADAAIITMPNTLLGCNEFAVPMVQVYSYNNSSRACTQLDVNVVAAISGDFLTEYEGATISYAEDTGLLTVTNDTGSAAIFDILIMRGL